MANQFNLENKTILTTGASSGIGKATAIECSKLGAKVIITGRNAERLNETFSELDGEGHIQIVADLNEQTEIDSIVEEIPQLDGIVNNAGISCTKLINFIKQDDLDKVFKTNTFAPIMLTKTVLKKKKLKNGASIVFVSSMASFNPEIGNGIYGASKAALTTFMTSCAKELAVKQIRANAVHPGMVKTPLTENLIFSEEEIQKDIARYPLKRYGEPKDVANGIIYLLSDASAWVTGTSLMINGGIHLN